ncbi:hypothetical protein NUV89_23810 [Pseudomonas sp. 18.1.10]|uniref:hypothetical protein n=1 Tax=Pseudomonas sp. 18.1.10 TaxID=2969302 RepID=UPI0021505696|nr:hypothetical protein [Pseudomonas sp. 18.1.10]MCR4541427.1 hypothetical protein [Pseudomonas sp. 18.1.10]
MGVMLAKFSIPWPLWRSRFITFARQLIAQQSAEKRTFERCNRSKKRHVTLHELNERGLAANQQSQNLCLSIRQI